MRRFGRYMALIAVWYVSLFVGGDAAWQHFAHHPIPLWAATIRMVLWLYVVLRSKVPGYKRFVVKASGQGASEAVPEAPTASLVGWRAWHIRDTELGA